MSLVDRRPPRLTHGLDMRTLPLSPEEAFLLSRIDGSTPASEIAAATGLPEERVLHHLEHLSQLGAISFGPGNTSAVERGQTEGQSSPWRASSVRIRPVVETATQSLSTHPGARAYDLELLNEPVDLDLERKKLILDHFHTLDQLTHYALLQVSEQASKTEIKEAYYLRVGLFHPDRYFGKELGSYKPKLERVFGALTKAYDTLVRKQSREEYDRYLAAKRKTASLSDSAPLPHFTPLPSEPSASERSVAQITAPAAPSAPRASLPPADPEAARRALARRLRGGRASFPPPSGPASSRPGAADPDRGGEQAISPQGGLGARLNRYRELAAEAMTAKDYASALNALKIARTLAPEDPDLKALLESTQAEVDVALADQFLERAQYEEKDGNMKEAASSFERAARGKNRASLYDRAARCWLASGDARRAVEAARRAVELDGTRGPYRLTLARAYHLGDLAASARLEIRRAAELSPDNTEIKTWLKRLK